MVKTLTDIPVMKNTFIKLKISVMFHITHTQNESFKTDDIALT